MNRTPATIASRAGLSALGLVIAAMAVLWGGTSILLSETGVADLVETAYRLVGAASAADDIATYGLTSITEKSLLAGIALVVGVGGVWLILVALNRLLEVLGGRYERLVRPWVFVLPAVVLVGVYLVYPAVRTIVTSVTETGDGGLLSNYRQVFTQPDMLAAIRNNVLWLVLGTTGSVFIGLVFATLVDRVKREALAKTFVFLPLAISMVGAAVIWRFVFYWRPSAEPQIGLANGILEWLGREPVAFFQTPPINTLALIVVMIWLQTGFAMVILSAAIKGVPDELVEAARIDGASELQVFRRIIVPSIRGSLITVTTTVFIVILKVFDIVFVTTGGRFDSDVIANRMFQELVRFRNPGTASALAVVLLVAVVPIMVVNVRNLRHQGASS
ncbi:MAG TPA: sugar ABC transporter permease [Acidimicrobiia bacterium]|nr:sugar ABC transporter permease [Acidimicrobiia bacterium]